MRRTGRGPWARGLSCRAARRLRPVCGYSLVEMLVVIGIVAVAVVVAVPGLGQAADAADAAGAARYLAAIVARARLEAARRQAAVALRFGAGIDDPPFTLVLDGDGDGVTAADVAAGVDPAMRPADQVSWHFRRARLTIARSAPGIEGSAALAAGDDPVQFGAARQVTLTPLGTATSGTVYISSRAGALWAVRIAGVTGRSRVLRLQPGTAQWVAE